jgi:hypothetical protein
VDTALTQLDVVELFEYPEVQGMSDENEPRANNVILATLREKRLVRAKSVMGGSR